MPLACSALIGHGCRCQICADTGYYIDGGTSQCLKCPDVGRGIALLVGLVVGISVVVAVSFVSLVHPAGDRIAVLRPARRTVAWLTCYSRSIGFLPKLKILFSFFGIITVMDEVYDAKMPSAYTEWVGAPFNWVQIDWVSTFFPGTQCRFSSLALLTHAGALLL